MYSISIQMQLFIQPSQTISHKKTTVQSSNNGRPNTAPHYIPNLKQTNKSHLFRLVHALPNIPAESDPNTHTITQLIKDPLPQSFTPLIDISAIHSTRQKCKTNGIQTSHVLTNHTTIWTCTSLTSPIGTRGGAVSLI